MSTYSAEGIILNYKDFGEADRLITIYSRQYGKLKLVAKGVRRITSRKGGNLDLLNHGKFLVAEGRNLDIVSEVYIENTFTTIKNDLERSGFSYFITEIINRLTVEKVPSKRLYQLLFDALSVVDDINQPILPILSIAFELQTLSILGFWSEEEALRRFNPSEEVRQIFRELKERSLSEVGDILAKEKDLQSAKLITESFLNSTLDGSLRSPRFINDIKQLNKSPKL